MKIKMPCELVKYDNKLLNKVYPDIIYWRGDNYVLVYFYSNGEPMYCQERSGKIMDWGFYGRRADLSLRGEWYMYLNIEDAPEEPVSPSIEPACPPPLLHTFPTEQKRPFFTHANAWRQK